MPFKLFLCGSNEPFFCWFMHVFIVITIGKIQCFKNQEKKKKIYIYVSLKVETNLSFNIKNHVL